MKKTKIALLRIFYLWYQILLARETSEWLVSLNPTMVLQNQNKWFMKYNSILGNQIKLSLIVTFFIILVMAIEMLCFIFCFLCLTNCKVPFLSQTQKKNNKKTN